MVKLVFIKGDGVTRLTVEASAGQSVMEAARAHDIEEMEGACEGAMACSTCHVILKEADYDRLPQPSESEEELLDLAYGARPTSRLGCQIEVTEVLDGIELQLPKFTRNMLF